MNTFNNKTKAPNREYKICSRCVMDTSDPWITFDEKSHCNHCRTFFEKRFRLTQYTENKNDSLNKLFDKLCYQFFDYFYLDTEELAFLQYYL